MAFSAPPAGFPRRPVNSQCKIDHLSTQERHRFLDVKQSSLVSSMMFRLNTLASFCDERVSNLKMVRKLGQGSFGIVLLCTGSYKGRQINVAVKELHAGGIGKQSKKEVEEEGKLGLRMGKLGSGPVVYDLFYASIALKAKGQAIFQYVLMEPFDTSVSGLFKRGGPTFGATRAQIISAVVPETLKALRLHLEAGVKCYDVKPGNFVCRPVNGKGKKLQLEVKMIDFGFPHCNIKRERTCDKVKCDLDASDEPTFILLCAQVLFMMREDVSRTEALAVMKAAEQNSVWHRRASLADAAIKEFQTNRMLRSTYNWYRNGDESSPRGKKAAEFLLKQLLDDLWLKGNEK